jgi:hypothetical protein
MTSAFGNTALRNVGLPKSQERAYFIGGWVNPRAGLDDMVKWTFLTPSGLELPSALFVQPVASRYTDWAIPYESKTADDDPQAKEDKSEDTEHEVEADRPHWALLFGQ